MSTDAPAIRRYAPADWSALWRILEAVIEAGDTYAWATDSGEAAIHAAWIEAPSATFVALQGDDVVGSYYLKPNQVGRGAHVCNAGYVVASEARGRGVAAAMCEHSQVTAIAAGFRAMQFNFVVSTNAVAVRLWQRLGFAVVGTLPAAFDHRQRGFVDAWVMFKSLVPVPVPVPVPILGAGASAASRSVDR